MPYIKGDISLSTQFRKKRPRLFSAALRVPYDPQRHKTITTWVYQPVTHLDEPGIFVSIGAEYARMSPDQLDQLIDHLSTHRQELIYSFHHAKELSRLLGLAIKNSNSVINNDPPPAELLQSTEGLIEEVGIPSVLPHGGDPLQSSSENVPDGAFLEGVTASPDTAAPLEINENE